MRQASLSVRVDAANPRHHQWLNHGTWWIHYTLHTPQGRIRRVRSSLGTGDLGQAKRLRDSVFAVLEGAAEVRP